MSFKLDKNIPVPKPKGTGRKAIYPWAEMRVGDSFLRPVGAREKASKVQGVLLTCARQARKSLPGFLVVTRRVAGGVRVWRVADTAVSKVRSKGRK